MNKLSISFDDERLEKLKEVAKNQERSMNYIVNKALEIYLNEALKDKKEV